MNSIAYVDQKSFESIYANVDEIAAILFAILKTTRINKNPK